MPDTTSLVMELRKLMDGYAVQVLRNQIAIMQCLRDLDLKGCAEIDRRIGESNFIVRTLDK